jgi:hypothetical protein
LDETDLGEAKSALVRDVINVISRLRVLTVDATNLDIELVGDLLEFSHLGSKLRKSNMDRGAKGSSEVGRARSDIAEMIVMSKAGNSLNVSCSLGEAGKDGTDVCTWLH